MTSPVSHPANLRSVPRATVRLQFRKEFTLIDATRHVDQFAALGVSHIYASPLQKSRSGSSYGYDIIDYSSINPELGGEQALSDFVAALRKRNMGLILDIVPNHMSASYENEWWQRVLEGGSNSVYADYFDVDWQSPDAALRGKVLAPYLGTPYAEALTGGNLNLRVDAASGKFFVEYFKQRFPIALRDYAAILNGSTDQRCKRLAALFKDVGSAAADYRYAIEARRVMAQEMANGGAPAILKVLTEFDPQKPDGHGRLHRLLERQHYRLAWWRTAAEEINWRRFFEVSDLVGMRVDRSEVFADQHALIFRLYQEGLIDGVRVDHVDGLANPRAYCRLLRERFDGLAMRRASLGLNKQPYIVIEKILGEDEMLPSDWNIDGTTGYDFMDEVSSLLHDQDGAEPLQQLWQEVSGDTDSFRNTLFTLRHQLLDEHFFGEFEASARVLHRIARFNIETRDVSLGSIRRALHALLVCFPLYRLYADKTGRKTEDALPAKEAMACARSLLHVNDHATLEQVDRWLGAEPPESAPSEFEVELRLRAINGFQQLTPPLAAKALEDTTFYRYGRLLSRNEVGSNPQRVARTPKEFHDRCAVRRQHFPHAMLATASHDHKRGEDLRARLAVLSEMPQQWDTAVTGWCARNKSLRGAGRYAAENSVSDANEDMTKNTGYSIGAPDQNDEYMLYQMLVGAWPPKLRPNDLEGVRAFAQRIAIWQEKALREAKRHSGWMIPNISYEKKCRDFLWRILGLEEKGLEVSRVEKMGSDEKPEIASTFIVELAAFVARIENAGVVNSLSQTLLRMTCPGVPDLYQGTDLWDFSLVDPDNRTLVQYDERINVGAASLSSAKFTSLLANWRDGRIKQQLISTTLALRKQYADLFANGTYHPLEIEGPHAQNAIAFARNDGERWVVVIASRLVAKLLSGSTVPMVAPALWGHTAVRLPDALASVNLTSTLVKHVVPTTGGRLALSDALAVLPVAILITHGANEA